MCSLTNPPVQDSLKNKGLWDTCSFVLQCLIEMVSSKVTESESPQERSNELNEDSSAKEYSLVSPVERVIVSEIVSLL